MEITERQDIYEDGRWIEREIERQEKEEVARLRDLIKQAQSIEETLQAQYVRLTGCRCF